MTINSINRANTQIKQMGTSQATDSYSRNIQNQIANAQKQLQELSSNEDMNVPPFCRASFQGHWKPRRTPRSL